MVIELPSIKNERNGKMHKLPFPIASWRTKAPLELVHADIWGPTKNPSLGGKRYFLLFVDDYFRMMWGIFPGEKIRSFFPFHAIQSPHRKSKWKFS